MALHLQAYGLQPEMRLCTWLVSCAYPSDQHDAKADTADVAMFSDSQGKMAKQGRAILALYTLPRPMGLLHFSSNCFVEHMTECVSQCAPITCYTHQQQLRHAVMQAVVSYSHPSRMGSSV